MCSGSSGSHASGVVNGWDGQKMIDEDPIPDYSEPSTILYRIRIIRDETEEFEWSRMVADIYGYEGGAAEYEQDINGFLDYCIVYMLDHNTPEGFYVMEGFTTKYWKDYWGEVDCSHDYTCIRKATEKDWEHFGVRPEDGSYEL